VHTFWLLLLLLLQTFEKKKATDKMSIPLQLDVGAVLGAAGLELPAAAPLGPDGSLLLPGGAAAQYELAAVLIHKGTSASHGHYGKGLRLGKPAGQIHCLELE
jgi:hypothetical protein